MLWAFLSINMQFDSLTVCVLWIWLIWTQIKFNWWIFYKPWIPNSLKLQSDFWDKMCSWILPPNHAFILCNLCTWSLKLMDVTTHFIFWSSTLKMEAVWSTKTWYDFIIQKAAVWDPMETSTLEVTIYVYIAENRVIRSATLLLNGKKLVSVCPKVKVNLSLCRPWRHVGGWRYSFMLSQAWQKMEMSGQLHALTAVSLE